MTKVPKHLCAWPSATRRYSRMQFCATIEPAADTIRFRLAALQCAGKPVPPGLLSLTSASKLGWTRELHAKNSNVKAPDGNLLFVDGHVEWNKQDPSAALQRPDAATNRLAVP
jgi:prepilin-type processing-associated H-X9-DG protein